MYTETDFYQIGIFWGRLWLGCIRNGKQTKNCFQVSESWKIVSDLYIHWFGVRPDNWTNLCLNLSESIWNAWNIIKKNRKINSVRLPPLGKNYKKVLLSQKIRLKSHEQFFYLSIRFEPKISQKIKHQCSSSLVNPIEFILFWSKLNKSIH